MKSAVPGHGIFSTCPAGQYTPRLRIMHVQDVKVCDKWCQYLPLKYILTKMCHLVYYRDHWGKLNEYHDNCHIIRADFKYIKCTYRIFFYSLKTVLNY